MKKVFYYALSLLLVASNACTEYLDDNASQLTEGSAQSTREPFLWPFSENSIWNQPIGSGAIYEPANFEAAGEVGVDVVHVLQPAAADPTYPVYNTVSFKADRCGGTTYLGFDLQVPRDWTVPDAGEDNPYGRTPNSSFALVSTDGQTVYQGQVITRCEADGPVYLPEWMKYEGNRPQISLRSDGLDAGTGHGASRMSTLGGTIRLSELVGDAPIRHAIKINPWASKYLFYSEEIPGYRWPAQQADGYAGEAESDIRYNINGDADSNILMGSLFAIPPGVSAESLGLTSKPARKLFYALQNFGMYFVEDAAYDTWDIVTERGVGVEFEQTYGYSMSSDAWKGELNKLMQALSVVVNNGPASIGGGGQPIAPLAPPFR